MAHDVFVSYSTHDKLIADAACAVLEGHGIRCWIAPRDIMPGVDWTDAIIDGITECRVFLLLLSNASNLSEQVKREVQNAVSEGKAILPLRIEEVDLSKHMRYFIGTPHWMDALTPPMEIHLLRMTQTIQTLLDSMDEKGIELPHAAPFEPTSAIMPSAAPPLTAGPTISETPPATIISAATEAQATQVLAEFIGPLAKMLVKRAARESVSHDDFCRSLADQVSSPAEKAQLLKKLTGC